MKPEERSAEIRSKLIKAGVKNLIEFGYPTCNEKNILTDDIYSRFFKGMLVDNKGKSHLVDKEIDALLKEINEKTS